MLIVPFTLNIIEPGDPPGNEETIKCEILVGFVGLTQNVYNASLKPEIGWLILERLEISESEIVHENLLRFKH